MTQAQTDRSHPLASKGEEQRLKANFLTRLTAGWDSPWAYVGYYLLVFGCIAAQYLGPFGDLKLYNQGDYYRQLFRLGLSYTDGHVVIEQRGFQFQMLKFNSNDLLYYPLLFYKQIVGGNYIEINELFIVGMVFSFLGAAYAASLVWKRGTYVRLAFLLGTTLLYVDQLYVLYKKSCYQENMALILLVPFLAAVLYERRLFPLVVVSALFLLSKAQNVVFILALAPLVWQAIGRKNYLRVITICLLMAGSVVFAGLVQKSINGARINPPNSFFFGLLYKSPSLEYRQKVYTYFQLDMKKYEYLENRHNVGIYDIPFSERLWSDFESKVSLGKIVVYYCAHPVVIFNRIATVKAFQDHEIFLPDWFINYLSYEHKLSVSNIFKKYFLLFFSLPMVALILPIELKRKIQLLSICMISSLIFGLSLVGDGFNEYNKHVHLAYFLAPATLVFLCLELMSALQNPMRSYAKD